MKKLALISGAALCLSLTACGDPYRNDPYAADRNGRMEHSDNRGEWKDRKADMKTEWFFEQADTNGDGSISRTESRRFGDQMFRDADANGDGRLSYEEVKMCKMKEMEEMHEMKKQY